MRTMPLLAIGLGTALAVCCVPAFAADLARGSQVYRQHCIRCHGASGMSSWPGAPNLAYRETLMKTDQAFVQALRKGSGAKPSYQGIISDVDLLSLIAYTRTLAR